MGEQLNANARRLTQGKLRPEADCRMPGDSPDSRGLARRPGVARSGGACCAVALAAVALLAGAGGPEIVRVRVPSKDVSKWFPAGTELRVMPAKEFNSLVGRANEGLLRRRAADPPRLIRARHHARLSKGVLVGRTELVIEAARSGPADFLLEPWTPAILPSPGSSRALGAPRFWKAEPLDRSGAQPDDCARLGTTAAIAPGRAEFRARVARERNNGAIRRCPQELDSPVSAGAAARAGQ